MGRREDYSRSSKTLLTGWGRVAEGADWSRQLKKVRIPIVSDSECDRNVFHYTSPSVQNLFSISDKQICAGDLENIAGPCNGDSGGPLTARPETADGSLAPWSLVGLVSWRIREEQPGGG